MLAAKIENNLDVELVSIEAAANSRNLLRVCAAHKLGLIEFGINEMRGSVIRPNSVVVSWKVLAVNFLTMNRRLAVRQNQASAAFGLS